MEISTANVTTNRANSIWVGGAIALALSLIASSLIQLVAVLVLKPEAGFTPLAVGTPQTFTLIGVVGATIVYAIVRHYANNPGRLFSRIALGVLVVTMIPDFGLLVSGTMPGANIGTTGALILMHLAVWAITVRVLIQTEKRA